MNILSGLLPGARQIRTPLVVGYLWFLVAWINVAHVPVRLRHGLLIARASQDFKHLSPALVIIILSFIAYLVGLFFELFDDIAVKIAIPLAGVAVIIVTVSVIVVFIVGLWPVTLAVLAIIVLAYYRRTRRFHSSIDAEFDQSMVNMSIPVRNLYYRLKNVVLRVWSNANPVRNDLVAGSIIKLLDNHPEVTAKFCETLSIVRLRNACYEAGLRSNKAASQIVNPDGTVVNVAAAARRSSIEPASEKLLRDYLAQRMAASSEVRRSVVLRVMNTSDVRQLVDRGVEDAATHIQANMPSVSEACDRLRAEGELRRGAAVPLGVALSSACAVYTTNIWLILSAAIPAVFVYFSGMKKQEEAIRTVVSFIAARIMPVDLDVNDVRLLRWQTKESKKPSRGREIVSAIMSHRAIKRLFRSSKPGS
jgi:hypothetical protein